MSFLKVDSECKIPESFFDMLKCFRHATLALGNFILAIFCLRLIYTTTLINKLKQKLNRTKLILLYNFLIFNIATIVHFGIEL